MTRRRREKKDPYALPPPIPDTAENIARALLATPPRKREDWKFVQEREKAPPARREEGVHDGFKSTN